MQDLLSSCPQVLQFQLPALGLLEKFRRNSGTENAVQSQGFNTILLITKGPWNLNLLEDGKERKEGEQTTGVWFHLPPTTPPKLALYLIFLSGQGHHACHYLVPFKSLRVSASCFGWCFEAVEKRKKGWGRWLILSRIFALNIFP